MKPRNLAPLIKKYGAGYTLEDKKGKILAHSKRIDILFKKIGERADLTIGWLPEPNVRYTKISSRYWC
ncbi:hypothetical protein HZB69_02605 [Candidatus Amesbacteria bacterium]|nr:hypothetical protein [Candidatus Amesbacteria bacterium]